MIHCVQFSQKKPGPKWDNTDSRTIKTTRAQREKLTKESICQEDTTVWMCMDHFSMHEINTDGMKRKSDPRLILNCSGDSPHRRPRHWIQRQGDQPHDNSRSSWKLYSTTPQDRCPSRTHRLAKMNPKVSQQASLNTVNESTQSVLSDRKRI